jgi:hypothetical protein
VMVGQRGPGGGDGREDGAVPGHDSDGSRQDGGMVSGHGGEGQADGTVPKCFNMEEEQDANMEKERGIGVEAHTEDVEEERASVGVWWGNDRVRV